MVTNIFNFIYCNQIPVQLSKRKMGISEEQIIIRNVINGDIQSFEQIVNSFQDMVTTLCFRILKNREEAEEIAQDVFVKVYQSLSKFNSRSRLSTWIYRIAYNTSVNRYKSQRKHALTTEIDNKTEYSMGSSPDAHYELSKLEKKDIIDNAISKLPDIEQIIITLYYYDELSVGEIAEITGISKQNVKVRLFRSRQKLYAELKDKVGNEIMDYEYC